jgi:hypothetical protein
VALAIQHSSHIDESRSNDATVHRHLSINGRQVRPLVPASGPAGVADGGGHPASHAEMADSLSLVR